MSTTPLPSDDPLDGRTGPTLFAALESSANGIYSQWASAIASGASDASRPPHSAFNGIKPLALFLLTGVIRPIDEFALNSDSTLDKDGIVGVESPIVIDGLEIPKNIPLLSVDETLDDIPGDIVKVISFFDKLSKKFPLKVDYFGLLIGWVRYGEQFYDQYRLAPLKIPTGSADGIQDLMKSKPIPGVYTEEAYINRALEAEAAKANRLQRGFSMMISPVNNVLDTTRAAATSDGELFAIDVKRAVDAAVSPIATAELAYNVLIVMGEALLFPTSPAGKDLAIQRDAILDELFRIVSQVPIDDRICIYSLMYNYWPIFGLFLQQAIECNDLSATARISKRTIHGATSKEFAPFVPIISKRTIDGASSKELGLFV